MPKSFALPVKKKVDLTAIDPSDTGGILSKEEIIEETLKLKEEFQELQEMLVAGKKQAVLFVFQGMDCSGKDGVIKHVFSGLNPQGVSSYSFKTPTEEESLHDFLWRAHTRTPALGHITTFNRSYYEDVLITRVHDLITDKVAKRRFKHINHFEELLNENHTLVVKIFLHISKEFQMKKLKSRIEDPSKNWKLDPNDIEERKSWKQHRKHYEEVLEKCSSASPWYIVPSDHRWYRDFVVLSIAVESLRSLKLKEPDPNPELIRFLEQIAKED
ncbi:PPK2 family polyphosphate kinase [Paenibacillus glacialis]|uniref:Polyphosphate kinase n=1 Tax=Paenibacillus glacialis TaxID=494026 RepID=A0A168LDI6_9BACL|nr:PPK2 family polyphosphate kinase [Paenibacillus glacialis]OAB43237.1 polyphosphate kinase [Paenibacillus glacialis]